MALFDSYMERMLASRVKIERLETELKSLESYVDSVKYESGKSVLDPYKKQRLKNKR